jgi:hypothetical protein
MDKALVSLFEEFEDPTENLPPEMLLDPHHPNNDKYYDQLSHIKLGIKSATANLRPIQLHALLYYRQGLKFKEIAEKLDIGYQTASRWVKLPEAKSLSVLMDHHQQQLDGPNINHRKAILYRIMKDNEQYHPSIAIKALQEINKMSGVYAESVNNTTNNIMQIQINGDLLPRGALDTLPDTYETRMENQSNVIEGDFS